MGKADVRFPRDFFLAAAASMLVGVYAIMLMSLTLLYGNDRGFSSVAAGFLSSSFAFASLGIRPFSGLLCDRYSKKALLLLSGAGFALCPLAFLAEVSCALLTAVRILQGVCMGLVTTAAGAIATSCIPRERFTAGISYYGISLSASGAIAPGVGLWLLNRYGYDGVFLFSCLLGVGIVLLALPLRPVKTAAEQSSGGFWRGLYERTALYSAGCTLLLALAQIPVMQLLSSYVTTRGMSGVGAFYALSTLAVISTRLCAARLRKRLGEMGLLLGGGALLLGTYLCFHLLPLSKSVLALLAITYGTAQSLISLILNTLAVADAPPERLGAANATYLAANDIGYALGPVLWNIYCAQQGYANVFLTDVILVVPLLAAFILKALPAKNRQ